jgi:hypothetical protein
LATKRPHSKGVLVHPDPICHKLRNKTEEKALEKEIKKKRDNNN